MIKFVGAALLVLLLAACQDKLIALPEHVVRTTPLSPNSGERVEIRADGDITRQQCTDLISYYRHLGSPSGQVSVHKQPATGQLAGQYLPWCVENFDGSGIRFQDELFD